MTTKPEVLFSTQVETTLVVFRPREDAVINGRTVNETEFLGSFTSDNGTKYVRLNASQNQRTGNPDKPFKATWGRCVAFSDLARALVGHIIQAERASGKANVSIRANAELQVQRNGPHINLVWLIYGYELNGKYYTTNNGALVTLTAQQRVRQPQDNGREDLFAAIERDGFENVVEGSKKRTARAEHLDDEEEEPVVVSQHTRQRPAQRGTTNRRR